jgi:hypothetical protein
MPIWSGLGMVMFSTEGGTNLTNAQFDEYCDTLRSFGFTSIRLDIPDYQNAARVTQSKTMVLRAIAKGLNVVWGLSSNSYNNALYTITATNWSVDVSGTVDSTADTTHFVDDALTGTDDYVKGAYFYNITRGLGSVISGFVADTDTVTLSTAITGMTAGDSYTIKGYSASSLDAALWAQTNAVSEFQIGNEEELHNDGTTLTDAQLRGNLKTLATSVQAIYTRGDVSYTLAAGQESAWNTLGRGDIDQMAFNKYRGGVGAYSNTWIDTITSMIGYFGADHTYLTEFALSYTSLADYNANSEIQARELAVMQKKIQDLGITRAYFFCYNNSSYGVISAYGAEPRLIWNTLTTNGKRRWFI